MNTHSVPTGSTPVRANDGTGVQQTDLPYVLTAKEAAKIARVSEYTIWAHCKPGGIPHTRFGRVIRIPRDPFLKWMESQGIATETEGLA